MKHLKTYEGFFHKEKDKTTISEGDINILVDDCLSSLRDNGLLVKIYPPKKDPYNIQDSCFWISINRPSKSDDKINFKDIKHDILQFCNMINDYNVELSFTVKFAHQWECNGSNYEPTYKKMLNGVYDKIQILSFGIYIKRKMVLGNLKNR